VLISGVTIYRTHQPANRDSGSVPARKPFIPDLSTRRGLAACACALLCQAAAVEAQGVHGRVFDEARAPVHQAQVELVAADGRWSGRALTDTAGAFRIEAPRAALYRVTVTHVAFQPWTSDTLRVGSAEMLGLEVRIGRTAIPLEPLVITARGHPRLAEFDERRLNRTFGRFLTREEIDARGTNRTSELLRTVPGVQLVPVVRRGRNNAAGNMIAMRGGLGQCSPSIFIDGVSTRQYQDSTIDDMLAPSQIEGVEVYTSASTAPSRYNEGTGCGVVLFWTRPGDPTGGSPWSWKRIVAGLAAIGIVVLLVR